MRYIIIGGGIAGTTAAEELRKLDASADITLISEEDHVIYSRVLLPHYVKNKIPRERVFLKKEEWYAAQNIEWLRSEFVTKIDAKNQFVEITNGQEIPYDKLLVANGGAVKLILDDVRGVSYFRTLDDADHLVELLKTLPKDAHAGIFGGGFIACEYLNMFRDFNLPTTIAFRGEHFWSNIFSKEAGELLNRHLRSNGVEVIQEASFESIIGEKEVEGFQTSKGKIACNILGVGIGIDSRFQFVKDAGIEVRDGIVCNEFLETNMPNIFTAGDVAEFFDARYNRHIRAGNWMNAMTQGRLAAKNMFGEHTAFDLVSSYASNALGLEMIFIGDTSRPAADETKLIGSVEAGGITELFVRNDQVVGAVLVGRNSDRAALTKLISEKGSPDQFA